MVLNHSNRKVTNIEISPREWAVVAGSKAGEVKASMPIERKVSDIRHGATGFAGLPC